MIAACRAIGKEDFFVIISHTKRRALAATEMMKTISKVIRKVTFSLGYELMPLEANLCTQY